MPGPSRPKTAKPLASNEFWKKLIKPCRGTKFPASVCIPADRRGQYYQPLEILTVETFRKLCPQFEWEASPVWGDQGADFIAAGARVTIPALAVTLNWILVGQVKRRTRPPEGNFGDELMKLGEWSQKRPESALIPADLETSPISGVIFVISTDRPSFLADLRAQLAIPYRSIYYTGPKYVVDADRLLAFWASDPDWFRSIVGRALAAKDLRAVMRQLEAVPPRFDPALAVDVETPRWALAGKTIRCVLHVRSVNPLPSTPFAIRYQQPPADAPIEVVRPSALVRPSGLPASVTGIEPAAFEILLRCHVAGRRKLGAIEILAAGSSDVALTIDLGSVDVEASFEPPYFAAPNAAHMDFARQHIAEAAGRRVAAFSVTGVGGAGKSRLCEAIVDYAADLGFAWIVARQQNAPTRGRQVLRRIMSQLCPVDAELATPEAILEQVRRMMNPIPAELFDALRTYFQDDDAEVNAQHIAAVLTALIVPALHQRPLILHLHDLHWAGAELFTILHLSLDYLRLNEHRLKAGVVVVLEGRNREALRSATGEFRPPDEWLRFLAAAGLPDRAVERWSDEECELYLLHSLQARVDPSRPIDSSRIPLHASLLEHVIHHAKGNPMHLMEQLRMLHKLGIVRVHDNGFLYAGGAIPEHYDRVPGDVLELIRARVALFRAANPRVVDMLVLFAKLGRSVSRALYDWMFARLDEQQARKALDEIEILHVPRRDDAVAEFIHENYFNALAEEELPPDSPLLRHAVAWYESLPAHTARDKADLCRLLMLDARPDYRRVLALLSDALEESWKAESGLLTEELLRQMLRVPAGPRSATRFDEATVRYELAMSLTQVGSWEEALAELQKVVALTARRRHDPQALLQWVSSKAEMSNLYVSMQQPEDAIAVADDAINEVEQMMSAMPQIGFELGTQLAKALHRKAVTLWFDGQAVAAATLQRKAFVLTRARNDRRENVVARREIGAIAFHRNLRFGIRMLEKAMHEASAIGHFVGEIYLDRAEWLMGRIAAAGLAADAAAMTDCLEESRALHHASMRYAMLFNGVLAALNAGAAAAWLGRLPEAHVWFRTGSAIAIQARLEDEAWKGRLNLAQVELELGHGEEARLNAFEAYSIICKGLNVNPNRRGHRRALLSLPLAHTTRLGVDSARVAPYLVPAARQWLKAWDTRPSFLSRRGQDQQVVHVRRGAFDYFLLN